MPFSQYLPGCAGHTPRHGWHGPLHSMPPPIPAWAEVFGSGFVFGSQRITPRNRGRGTSSHVPTGRLDILEAACAGP